MTEQILTPKVNKTYLELPDQQYLELFTRRGRKGWTSWVMNYE